MSKDGFNYCVKNGGKVVTKQLKGNRYINICYDKDGKSYAGEVRVNKKRGKSKAKRNFKRTTKVTEDQLQKLAEHFNAQRND